MARIGVSDVTVMFAQLADLDHADVGVAVDIAQAALLEVQHYQRVDARLRVLVERDDLFGVADMVRSTSAEPDSEPVLAVSVQEVLDVLDMES